MVVVGVEVGVGEVHLDARPEPTHGGDVGNVGSLRVASAAVEHPANTSEAVGNDGARLTGGAEKIPDLLS